MATDEPPHNHLLALYRRYVGRPTSERDVYAGFALFFGGIALGAIGLVVFLFSTGIPEGDPLFWQLREIAITLAALGLPAFILSIVVLLPVSTRAVTVAAAGAVICLIAVGVFIAAYPSNWNVPRGTDYSAQGIAVFAAGLAILLAVTGSALVAHHIERTRKPSKDSDGAAAGSTESRDETVTDEQVERDIEEALANTELTWGGVEKATTRRLRVNTPDIEGTRLDAAGFDGAAAKTARSEGVDDAVSGLRRLQGGERTEATGADVDEQTAALRELRAKQREQEAAQPASVVDRAKHFLGFD